MDCRPILPFWTPPTPVRCLPLPPNSRSKRRCSSFRANRAARLKSTPLSIIFGRRLKLNLAKKRANISLPSPTRAPRSKRWPTRADLQRFSTADPTVGGRYSVLTHFGLVPAALMGIDLEKLLARAVWMSAPMCSGCTCCAQPRPCPGGGHGAGRARWPRQTDHRGRPGAEFRRFLARTAYRRIDRQTRQRRRSRLIWSRSAAPSAYGNDRLFVYLRKDGQHDAALAELQKSGQPVLTFDLSDPYDLAAEFYRWEVRHCRGLRRAEGQCLRPAGCAGCQGSHQGQNRGIPSRMAN